MFPME